MVKEAEFVTVAAYLGRIDALAAGSFLASVGIPTALRDDQVAGLNWFYLPALGGVRLQVSTEDLAEATKLLADASVVSGVTPADKAYFTMHKRKTRLLALLALLMVLGAGSPFLPLLRAVLW
jgi:hypothetical protein